METKESPILFNAPMVCAILDGRKTQTRRVVRKQDALGDDAAGSFDDAIRCPYGQPGDRLWVRETHMVNDFRGNNIPEQERAGCEILYRASDLEWINQSEDNEGLRWAPSIHMPRWASRINLEITGVRVERLQEISVSDAIAEGYDGSIQSPVDPSIKWYSDLWESINGSGSWDTNPWVWVVNFRRIKP